MHPELVTMIQAIREAADVEERPAFSEEAAKKAKIPRSVLGLLKPLALKATKHGFAISYALAPTLTVESASHSMQAQYTE